MRTGRALFILMLLSLMTVPVFGFQTYLTDGNVLKWNRSVSNPVIYWTLNPDLPSNVTTTADQLRTRIEQSLAQWNNVETSFLQLEYVAPSENLNYTSVVQDRILIHIATGDDFLCGQYAAGCGGCSGITSGNTCAAGFVMLKSDLIDDYLSIYPEGFDRVIIHEVGHAIGLGHSDRHSIMAYHRRSTTVTYDDRTALSFLYPSDGEGGGYNLFSCASVLPGGFPPGSGPGSSIPDFFIHMTLLLVILILFRFYLKGFVTAGTVRLS